MECMSKKPSTCCGQKCFLIVSAKVNTLGGTTIHWNGFVSFLECKIFTGCADGERFCEQDVPFAFMHNNHVTYPYVANA